MKVVIFVVSFVALVGLFSLSEDNRAEAAETPEVFVK